MLCWYLKNSHLTNKPETNNALILPWLLPPPPFYQCSVYLVFKAI